MVPISAKCHIYIIQYSYAICYSPYMRIRWWHDYLKTIEPTKNVQKLSLKYIASDWGFTIQEFPKHNSRADKSKIRLSPQSLFHWLMVSPPYGILALNFVIRNIGTEQEVWLSAKCKLNAGNKQNYINVSFSFK